MPVPRCCYAESGRQCRSNGTGNPSLCRAHRLLLEDEILQSRKTAASDSLGDAIQDGLRTGRFRWDSIVGAALGAMVGSLHGQPGADRRPPPGIDVRSYGFWSGGAVPPRQRPVAPLEPDPQLELQRRLVAARQTLGFQPREPITQADVEKRRRELARKHHPDLGTERDRAARTQRLASVNVAADLLVAEGNLG